MFSIRKLNSVINGKDLVDAVCLAADTKPTEGIANGSLVLEMDTNKIYAFNEAGSAWIELA